MSGDHDGAIQIHWLVYLFPWWHQNQQGGACLFDVACDRL